MEKYPVLLLLLVSLKVFSQELEKNAVQNTVETFFKGFHAKDSLQIKKTVSKDIILQSISMDSSGKATLHTNDFYDFLKNIASIPKTVRFEEKIKSFHIQVDGAMAHAWTRYEFWLNGKFHHCGVNSFQLFKNGSIWRIIYLIDTRRREGCH